MIQTSQHSSARLSGALLPLPTLTWYTHTHTYLILVQSCCCSINSCTGPRHLNLYSMEYTICIADRNDAIKYIYIYMYICIYRRYPSALRMRKGTVPFRIAKILISRADSHRKNHYFSRKSGKFHKIAKKAKKIDFALARNIEYKKNAFLFTKNIQYFIFS